MPLYLSRRPVSKTHADALILFGSGFVPSDGRHVLRADPPVSGDVHSLEACYLPCLEEALSSGYDSVAAPLCFDPDIPRDRILTDAVCLIGAFLRMNQRDLTVTLCVPGPVPPETDDALLQLIEQPPEPCFDTCEFDIAYMPSAAGSAPAPKKVSSLGVERRRKAPVSGKRESVVCENAMAAPSSDLDSLIRNMDKGFAPTLFRLIDEKGLTDVECYKRANVSRKTFSKIRCDVDYRPSRETALAFAIALRLTLKETEEFLRTAGLSLSPSRTADVIVKYYIEQGFYDIDRINESLFRYDQPCLGV